MIVHKFNKKDYFLAYKIRQGKLIENRYMLEINKKLMKMKFKRIFRSICWRRINCLVCLLVILKKKSEF